MGWMGRVVHGLFEDCLAEPSCLPPRSSGQGAGCRSCSGGCLRSLCPCPPLPSGAGQLRWPRRPRGIQPALAHRGLRHVRATGRQGGQPEHRHHVLGLVHLQRDRHPQLPQHGRRRQHRPRGDAGDQELPPGGLQPSPAGWHPPAPWGPLSHQGSAFLCLLPAFPLALGTFGKGGIGKGLPAASPYPMLDPPEHPSSPWLSFHAGHSQE